MPTINQLSQMSQVSGADLLPVYSSNNGDARKLSISALLTYFQQQFASPTVSTNLYVPTTGFSIAVPTPVSEQQWILLQPAGTLASGTITLPLNTSTPDGTEVLVTSTQPITALTISPNGAAAVSGAPSGLSAGSAIRLRYYRPTLSWYAIADVVSYGAAMQTFLASPTSANLSAAVTGETGTGALVFGTSPALTTPDIGAATGTSLTTSGSVLISGTGKPGYATGSGGVVTQGSASGKATAVTLNKTNGSITMDTAILNANTSVSFTLTNSTIEAGDILVMNHISGGTAGAYTLNAQCAAGSAVITLRNVTAGNLTEIPVIRFAVVKAVSA